MQDFKIDMEVDFYPRYKPCGLVNSGNTCWLNSVIQAIYACAFIRHKILKEIKDTYTYDYKFSIERIKQNINDTLDQLNCTQVVYDSTAISFGEFVKENEVEAYELLNRDKNLEQYKKRLYTLDIIEIFGNILLQLDESVGGKISIHHLAQKLWSLEVNTYPYLFKSYIFHEQQVGELINILDYMFGLLDFCFYSVSKYITLTDLIQIKQNPELFDDKTKNYIPIKKEDIPKILLKHKHLYKFPLEEVIGRIEESDTILYIDSLQIQAYEIERKDFFDINIFLIPPKEISTLRGIFILQAVLIRRKEHFITLTPEGRFDDTTVFYGRRYFDFFCENGFDIDPFDLEDTKCGANFFIYEKIDNDEIDEYFSKLKVSKTINKFWKRPILSKTSIKITRIEDFKPTFPHENIYMYDGQNSLLYIDNLKNQELLQFKSLILNYMREDVLLYAYHSENFLENVADYQSLLPRTRLQYLLEESWITDEKIKKQYMLELLQCQDQQKLFDIVTKYVLPVMVEQIRKRIRFWIQSQHPRISATLSSVALSATRVASPENDFTPKENDSILDEGIPVYFKRFNVKQIKKHPYENISNYFNKSGDSEEAFEVIKKLNVISRNALIACFKNYSRELGISVSISSFIGMRGPGGAARPYEPRTAPSSSASDNPWDTTFKTQKEKIKEIAGDKSNSINFEYTPRDILENLGDNNSLSEAQKQAIAAVLLTINMEGGYSFAKYKKYLKYKNKYLQIKRLEK